MTAESGAKENADFIQKIKEILKANGINDPVSEVIVEDAGRKGEGFASQTQNVTVNFVRSEKKPLHLFVKGHTANESHSTMIDELKAFEKEALFLTKYVPAAKEFCKSKGLADDFVDFYPKCYYGDDKLIVMEDLVKSKGYELLDKLERQDLAAAKLGTTNLAKHHAISYAMIEEMGGPENFFQRFPNLNYEAYNSPIIKSMMEPSFANALKTNLRILETNDVEGAKEASEKLRAITANMSFEKLTEIINYKATEGDIYVLDHGDYWNNNMMFLRDTNGAIVGQVAIDFQITRYNSPALDLGYYYFNSIKPNVRKNHIHDLLDLYLCTFKKVTEDLGYPVNLTYEQLFQQFRRRFTVGFWMGFTIAIGPGMAILKEVDIEKVDVTNWSAILDELVQKWLDKNPGESKIFAEEIVSYIGDYKKFEL